MAIQTINIGNIANDGTGDDLREAFVKVNDNFEELDTRISPALGGENLGTSGTGIFAQKSDNNLQFKKLIGGTNTTLASTASTIEINSTGIPQIIFSSDSGSIIVNSSQTVNINGGTAIDTRSTGNQIFFDLDHNDLIERDPAPTLGGNLDADSNNISNAGTISANTFNGSLEGLVYGIDVRTINTFATDLDFGGTVPTITNFLDYIKSEFDVDYGTITAPADADSDFGSIV